MFFIFRHPNYCCGVYSGFIAKSYELFCTYSDMGTPVFMGDFNTDVNSFKMRRRDVELLHLVHDCIFCIANLLESSYGSLYNMTMNTVLLLTIYVCLWKCVTS